MTDEARLVLRLSPSPESAGDTEGLRARLSALARVKTLAAVLPEGARYALQPRRGGLAELAVAVRGLLRVLREEGALAGSCELTLEERSSQPLPAAAAVLVGEHFLVGPPRLRAEPPRTVLPLVDARAFGDGRHPATGLALHRLWRLWNTGASPRRVLDARCGNGLLAMAAGLLWTGAAIRAVDPDPTARAACATNATAAELGGRLSVAEGPTEGPFDLVLAHLSPRPLLALARRGGDVFAPGARLVATGFPWGEVDRIERSLFACGLRPTERAEAGGWAEILFER